MTCTAGRPVWWAPARSRPRSRGARGRRFRGRSLKRVSAAHADLTPDVRLLPEPQDPLLLAAVQLTGQAGRAPDDEPARLHAVIRQRHTSRHPFAEKDIPEDIRTTLQDAAARESAALLFPGPWHAEAVLDLVRDAESRDVMDSGAREDLVRWTRLGPEADTAVDSVPEYAFGPRKRDGKAPVRDFAGRRPVADRGTTTFEYAPHLALLSAPGDGPADWLRAGQALERVLPEATLADLATSLTSHALRPLSCACWSATRDRARGRCRWCCVSATARGVRPPAAARSLMFSTSCSRKTASV
ncbi:hypothetical protein QFZ22_001197 [Streptomyces canus]|uniref:Nitroreductase domain-containing protein n=1 Tax=Streptomyces canus TaxID=58343 RepID=A0AAW8F8X5_9ACTN|nr:hypothetical protein [Streptomyces canus]